MKKFLVDLEDTRHFCPWCGAEPKDAHEMDDKYLMEFDCGGSDKSWRLGDMQDIKRHTDEVEGCQWAWPREGVLEPMTHLTVLRVVKELEVLRDPEQHSIVQDMTEDQAYYRLQTAREARRQQIESR